MNRHDISFIGFGEAGQAFAEGLSCAAGSYDRKTDVASTRDAKLAEFERCGVAAIATNAEAVSSASVILSLVTADQAMTAARESAAAIASGTLFCDMNSVAPQTKRAAAEIIEAAGGRYVDVAVMAPVNPARRTVPLLISGPHAQACARALGAIGFSNMRVLPGAVGAASAVKMIRSVMVKGLEALSTECVLAAERAGVMDEALASLNASWPGIDWAEKADYNLERMMTHGLRRAAELDEVVKTLEGLAVAPLMTRGAAERQREIGMMSLPAPAGLPNKIAAIFNSARKDAG